MTQVVFYTENYLQKDYLHETLVVLSLHFSSINSSSDSMHPIYVRKTCTCYSSMLILKWIQCRSKLRFIRMIFVHLINSNSSAAELWLQKNTKITDWLWLIHDMRYSQQKFSTEIWRILRLRTKYSFFRSCETVNEDYFVEGKPFFNHFSFWIPGNIQKRKPIF